MSNEKSNEQWVPALDVYASAVEMREAQKRGGLFADRADLSMQIKHFVFCDALKNYTYRLGSDPQEPVNKHTKERPVQTEPDRMAYLIDVARQVLDGKTLQFERPVDGSWCSVTPQSVSGALSCIVAAMDGVGAAVRIKPEPVVSLPIYFSLYANGKPYGFLHAWTDKITHKLTITNEDGKLSAMIEELGK